MDKNAEKFQQAEFFKQDEPIVFVAESIFKGFKGRRVIVVGCDETGMLEHYSFALAAAEHLKSEILDRIKSADCDPRESGLEDFLRGIVSGKSVDEASPRLRLAPKGKR